MLYTCTYMYTCLATHDAFIFIYVYIYILNNILNVIVISTDLHKGSNPPPPLSHLSNMILYIFVPTFMRDLTSPSLQDRSRSQAFPVCTRMHTPSMYNTYTYTPRKPHGQKLYSLCAL